ncbi:MAG: hypothetical protein ACREFO_10665 [Acetobacteraceae bacterium]
MNVETLSCAERLPAGLAGMRPEHLAFAGRVLAFTYDERGGCDGFVLELGGDRELCFECREPAIQVALRRAFAARRLMTILAAATAPRRPVAILPGEA